MRWGLYCDDEYYADGDDAVDYGRLLVISISNLVHPVIYLRAANNN